jgi:hypothetical protein
VGTFSRFIDPAKPPFAIDQSAPRQLSIFLYQVPDIGKLTANGASILMEADATLHIFGEHTWLKFLG